MLYRFHMMRAYRFERVLTTATLLALFGLVLFDQFRSIGRTDSLDDSSRQVQQSTNSQNKAFIQFREQVQQSEPLDRKPHLVIHIGPSKTGTTSLQTDLTHLQDYLAMDNYTYAGRYYNPSYSQKGNLHLNPRASPLLEEARKMLKKRCTLSPRNLCCSSFKKMLDDYKQSRQNVIISEEALNHIWVRPADYVAIKEALQDEWNVTIVVGYRRFFEWLSSYKYQKDRVDHEVPWKTEWPGQGGRPLEGLFPNVFRRWRQIFPYTDFALDNIGDTFSVKLLNLHDGTSSVQSNFLCNIVPNAPSSCRASLDRDQKGAETTINTRAESSSFFYDAIATAAAQKGLVDVTKWRRRKVADAIQAHHEKVQNGTAMDLELDCPSEQQLEDFLQLSLELEKKLMPELFSSGQAEHGAAFHRKVEARAYCWVDTDAVLEEPTWKDFFSNFSNISVDDRVSSRR